MTLEDFTPDEPEQPEKRRTTIPPVVLDEPEVLDTVGDDEPAGDIEQEETDGA